MNSKIFKIMSPIHSFKLAILSRIKAFFYPIEGALEKIMLLEGRRLSAENKSKNKLARLTDVEFQIYSQWGEDGILSWLVDSIPSIPNSYVEFGVSDYKESNTRFLLSTRSWCGTIFDGSEKNILDIRNSDIYWRHNLNAQRAFITKDNINELISNAGLKGAIGILSIDIDGNDYWVWNSIKVIRPVIVVCEFNAVFGDIHRISTPYRHDFDRSKAHFSCLFFGASLMALIHLGKELGYTFVGTNSAGGNAFFILNEFALNIQDRISGFWAYPSLSREGRDESGELNYLTGPKRAEFIKNLKVENLTTGDLVTIESLGALESGEWQRCEARNLSQII
jgi:hypothetical protein